MQVIAKRTLRRFWEKHPRSKAPLSAWHAVAQKAAWAKPQDIKDVFGSAVDFVGDSWAIFDIGGNKYRLVVHIAYRHKRILIKFVGTRAEYDDIDPESV
jgi:mRNA interferase HigB